MTNYAELIEQVRAVGDLLRGWEDEAEATVVYEAADALARLIAPSPELEDIVVVQEISVLKLFEGQE